jgi:mono/diheme cytochrome c family protein
VRVSRRGVAAATRTRATLRRSGPNEQPRVFEPYEQTETSFQGLPFEAVLDSVYGPSWREEEELLFTCSDGYQPTLPVQRLLDHRAWLAFDRPGDQGFSIQKFESGKRRRVELAPFYLVWENLADAEVRRDGDYGWPYQLVAIDLIRAQDRYPEMTPKREVSADVLAGFSAFRVHCSRCHAINGEGGAIGPELNTPTSPTEYRSAEWLHNWIDDPAAIQPETRMPKINPTLRNRKQTIDQIIRYMTAMSGAKRSPTSNMMNGS